MVEIEELLGTNFIADAGSNPSQFLERIKSMLGEHGGEILGRMQRPLPVKKFEERALQELAVYVPKSKGTDIVTIISEYSIDVLDLAWTAVAAIRATPYASYENEYDSINVGLINFIYSGATSDAQQRAESVFSSQLLEQMSRSILEDDGGSDSRNSNGEASLKRRKIDISESAKAKAIDCCMYILRSSIESSSKLSGYSKLMRYLLPLSLIKPLKEEIIIPEGYDNVDGDGLCFYHAVARQLGVVESNDSEEDKERAAKILQEIAINEVLDHPDLYEDFVVAHGGGLEGLLNYHLQHQESGEGGWAENIMIRALANQLEHVIEIQLFDRYGNAIDDNPIRIIPQCIGNDQILRLGNVGNIHFVSDANGPIPGGYNFDQLDDEGDIDEGDGDNMLQEDEGEEEADRYDDAQYDGYPTPAPTHIPTSNFVPTTNTTSQVYFETLEFGDASSFEFLSVAAAFIDVEDIIA